MLRSDVIYRVIYSPTSFDYAHVTNGKVAVYPTLKRARLFNGDLPCLPIDHSELESALS